MTITPSETRVPAWTPSEVELAKIWGELLGAPPEQVGQDFFVSGGDSILAAALVARAAEKLNADLPLEAFVREPTIAGLARRLDAARAAGATAMPAPEAAPPGTGELPCSYGQERFWFIDQATESNPVSNVPWALRLRGELDAGRLEKALTRLVSRHEILRTRFGAGDGGRPVALVDPEPRVPLLITDLGAESDPEEAATALIGEHAGEPFDLTRGPLLRVHLIRLGAEHHLIQFVAHHIICDDWSKDVIMSELGALYDGGEETLNALPAPVVQFPAFARWERERCPEEYLRTELEHWQHQLAGAPAALELATDHPRPQAPSLRGARLRTPIEPQLASALRDLGREQGATFFMTMLAALLALLQRYTGQDDLVVGTAIDVRPRTDLERAIGLFTNVLALRTDTSGAPTFRELLARVRASTLDGMAHRDLPFDRLAAASPDRDPSRHAVFQVFYEFLVPAPLELPLAGVETEPFEVPKRTAEFDLALYLDEQRGGLDAVWEYSTDLFEPDTVRRLAGHFETLLAAVAADPDQPIDGLELLDEAERHRALVEWNETAAVSKPGCVDELFELQARRLPGAPAVRSGAVELSYAELNARANQIAHRLRELDVAGGACVGLCMDRSVDLIAAMLGILKAGAGYVPLNPDHPPARLAAQLASAEVRVLISEQSLGLQLPDFDGDVLELDLEAERLAALPDTNPERESDPHRRAYVLFTSGSTGAPKGVAVTHGNLANYTAHMLVALGEKAEGGGMDFASASAVSTDLGNTAIFPALAGGGCLHLLSADVATDAAQFAAYVAQSPFDVLKITPSHLASLLDGAAEASLLPRRWLIMGGEALSWPLAERVSVPGGPRLLNHYGPTEATVGCCTYELHLDRPRPPAATVPIGRPISGAHAYVLDSHMRPAPIGVPGELYIGGDGVALGYVGAPEQTALAFIPDPFAGGEARLYRTGDLARYLPDGNLEFLGRADQQVKIRGYRVEPAEVQAVLLAQPAIRQAAVVPWGEGEGLHLVAYVVTDAEELGADGVRGALEQLLPAYMVPAEIVLLEALPLTPNGKLDRSALPRPDERPAAREGSPEPLTGVQAPLAEIWAELLEHEVGVDENFFDVGGHSLLAIRLTARIRTELGVKLTLKKVIDAPTIRELAVLIEAAQGPSDAPAEAVEPVAPLPRVTRERPLRSSFAQEQFWLVDQLTPGSAAYNFSWPMRLTGPLDVGALKRAMAELVARHEPLRTRFVADDGQPMQVIESAGAPLRVVDLTDQADPEAAAEHLVDEQTQLPFDLAQGPLFRSQLLRLGPEDHVLQIVVHHIVFDGVSKVVLYRELSSLYEAFVAGARSPLGKAGSQYGDFAEWQRSSLDDDRLGRELAHWRGQLEGMPTALQLPTDRPRPPVASLRGARHRVRLPDEFRSGLERVARAEGVTFFTAVLALFDVLLYRYTGQEDLVVGTPVDTRGRRELEAMIGPFINTVVIRSDLSGAPSFNELLKRVQGRTLDAIDHKELPFERLVAALAPDRDLSRHPIFQALLALNPPEKALALGGVTAHDIDPTWSASRVDLFLVLDDLPKGLEAIWEYSTDLFDAATVERMAAHFQRLAEAAIADPGCPIDELEILDAAERVIVVEDWNQTDADVPQRRLEQLIADQAHATPDRIAVEFEDRKLSYAELEARANQLAHRLRGLGVGPEDLVGVCLQRSEELLVALLGTLKAGAAYVPIDPTFPAARQRFMLADAEVRVLVTQEELLGWLPVDRAEVLCLDRDSEQIAAEPTSTPESTATLDGLAYVIYTSGSTGEPKGVEIEHRALVNFLSSMRERPGLSAADVLVAVTTLSFDIAGLELYLPLICGARVVIAPSATSSDPRALARLLEQSGATMMQATPTTWRMLLDGGWRATPGFKALCGGEAMPPSLRDELVACDLELWNMYGPTETTIWSAVERMVRAGERLTIGRPIANTTLHVLDRRGSPVPVGVPGELHIGGTGLARGYRHREPLTKERFIADPFTPGAGSRLYRTGDLACRRSDGTVEYLGRIDNQVKLRGYRIELGEIEATLTGHPGLSAAVVKLHTGAGDEPTLVAYVVQEAPIGADELRLFLGQSLPGYMVPPIVVPLEQLPLTPNGKLDRNALPEPEELSSPATKAYRAPGTPTEETLAGLWSEVLGVSQVGTDDDFFALGGQSLLAARLVSRIDAHFGLELPLRTLFEAPTVAGLASRIDSIRSQIHDPVSADTASTLGDMEASPAREATPPILDAPPLVPVAPTRPTSFAQERFWFIDQVAQGTAAYNISWPVRLKGALDVVALERALTELVRRHEVLRTRFTAEDGRPVQVIEPARAVPLRFLDLAGDADRESRARRVVDEETQAPFEISSGPPLRATLIRLGERDHILQVVVHHIAADGWSKVILWGELGALYAALRENRPAALAELPVQYADFSQWQRTWLQDERLERELTWWRAQLDGMPTALELPTDRPRPAVASLRGRWLRTAVSGDVLEAASAFAREQGATLFMVMLAAFEALVHRYTGQEDIAVGTPVDTRGRAELEPVIGPFVNTIVLRGDLSGQPSFRELVSRVRARTLDAIEHKELPFERLVEALAPDRDLSRHPIIQVLFALNPPEPGIELADLESTELETEKTAARVDLTLLLQEGAAGLDAVWEYSTDLFDPATVAQLARHYLRLLATAISNADRPIDELELLDADERRRLLALPGQGQDESGGPRGLESPPYAVAPLHELFAAQVARAPDAVAVVDDTQSVSYGELNQRANLLAHHLQDLGVEKETLVALCLERSIEIVVGILAVLKAGGAYVPLDPDYPPERLAFVLGDCQAPVLITQEKLLNRLPDHDAAVVCIDRDRDAMAALSAGDPEPVADPGSLAYVIYTSGSTGRPKGVLVEHGNVARLFSATDAWFEPSDTDTWTLLHSYAFDFSVWEIWGALLRGGRVVVVPSWTARSPDALAGLLVRERVTVLSATPSLFTTAMDELLNVADELSLRFVVFGGEALLTRALRPWFDRLAPGGPTLVNMYGITETTVHVTYRPLTPQDAERDLSPIGRPIPDLQLYLLDPRLGPVPEGVAGELFVGGAGVARGYLNRPELTAERFLNNPFGSGRLYRTGDRARWVRGEGLVFEGRLDDQVKIRGFRIELGEIQAALGEHPEVAECAVVADTAVPGDARLAGYVVPTASAAGSGTLIAELRDWLRSRLPEYMVPASLTVLDALPLTTNGKLDRRALPAPVMERSGTEKTQPTTPVECELAELWRELLDIDDVGTEESFFDLGGHSLLAAQLAARVRARFQNDISVRAVFEAPTIAGLAHRLQNGSEGRTDQPSPQTSTAAEDAVEPRRPGEAWPLSHSQRQLWLLDQWDPGAPTYNVALAFRVRGGLDVSALQAGLTTIVERHEALRTTIEVRGDEPVPVLLEPREIQLTVIDLAATSEGTREAELLCVLDELARRPFQFSEDLLLRASVIRLGADEHVVLIETHHIAFDGVSEQVLLEELSALYGGATLAPVPLQFGDFALWERGRLQGEGLEQELAWWRRHLAGAPTSIELPLDRPRQAGFRAEGATHELRLPASTADAVQALLRAENVTPYMLVLATLTTMLYRITGQDDILVGSPAANRESVEVERVIGFFSNTLVFRTRLDGDPTFAELLARVREMALDVYAHQRLPFEKLVEALSPDREPGINPLFQVNLRVSATKRPALRLGGLETTRLKVESGFSRFDLALDLEVREGEIDGYFRYNREIFEPATIARLADEFTATLEAAANEPGRRLLSFGLRHDWSVSRGPSLGLRSYRRRAPQGASPATGE